MDIQTLSAAIALCSKRSGASDLGIATLQKEIAAIKNGTTVLPYLSSEGGELSGSINLNNNTINNISSLAGTKIILNSQVNGQISADGKVISDIGIPVSDNDAATKKFVEDAINEIDVFLKLDGTSAMTGDLNLNNNKIKNINFIESSKLDISIDNSLLTMEKDPSTNLVQLKGVAEPVEDNDVVTQKFGNSQYAPFSAAIRPTVTGNPITVTDSAEAPVQELCVYGRTEQDGTPSPENPVPLVSAEDVSVTLSDGGDGSQTLTLAGDLPGIPVNSGGNYTDPDGQQWVCNYRDWARGVDVQMVAQETLSGTPAFVETTDVPGRFSWNNALSNTYKDGGSKSLLNFAQWSFWSNPGTNTRGATNVKHVLFSPVETMTEEEVNALFVTMIASDTPPTVIGQLATPVETPIPAEELAAYKALTTYDGTTNVMATDGAGLSLRYVADTQKYIDNKIAELQQQLAETQNALLEG